MAIMDRVLTGVGVLLFLRARRRRKYPDSAEGSTQAIDARDQELFADF